MNERPRTPSAGSGRRSMPARRAWERRVLWVGLMISLVAHVLIGGIVGAWLEQDTQRQRPRSEPFVVEPPRGLRAVQLAPVPDRAEPEPPEEPERQEPELESRPVVAQTAPADSLAADTLTAGDRLAARVVDPRLWQPMILLPREPTIEDVEARIAAAVELLSDSALADVEAAMRARNWTVEDANGGQWGISPGKLHLGKLTLPLPIWFPVDPGAVTSQQQWYELERQLDRARILESFKERVRAIRERRDRERAERQNGENGGG